VLDRSAVPEPLLEDAISDLRSSTSSERCTLRLNVAGDYAFPVICEALAPGVASLRDFRTLPQLDGPTFRRIRREKSVVVQNDCLAAAAGADEEFAEPYFRRLIELYGGMSAFIAAPVWIGEQLEGVISVHALGAPRTWSAADIEATEDAQAAVQNALDATRSQPAPPGAVG
jgi:GAF domain-containing protein